MATKSESVAIGVLQDQMKNVQDDVKEIKADMKVGFQSLESKIDDLDKKFAAKWVQIVVGGLIAAILLGFIGVVVAFFIPQRSQTTSTNPSTSETTTTTTPTGSTSTTKNSGTTGTSSPSTKSDQPPNNPNGGVTVDLPKVTP